MSLSGMRVIMIATITTVKRSRTEPRFVGVLWVRRVVGEFMAPNALKPGRLVSELELARLHCQISGLCWRTRL